MQVTHYSEQLQEALIHLERIRREEKKAREESDAILQGLSALVGAGSRKEVLAILQNTFRRLIHCHQCLVLQQRGDELVTDDLRHVFPVFEGFRRVLDGGVLNAFDVGMVKEWADVEMGIVSALHLPLTFSDSRGMLVITSKERGAFTRESIELARRIIPFSEQAVSKIEFIEQAHAREMDEQRKLMRQILDHAPIGVFLLSPHGQVKFANRAFCQTVGVSEETFIDAGHYSEILPADIAEQCMQSDKACLQKNALYACRETMVCADGEQHIFDVMKIPVENADGEVVSIVGISVDITEQLAREKEKDQMQQQLLHTQKLESLGVLAGGIAHDFNNILTAIMGHAALAETKFVRDPLAVEQHLHKIVGATEKAADLCKQMLAYSGHGNFVIKPLDLSALIESILNILEVSLNKGVVLKLSLMENLPLVEADASQIHQVIMNLITNANEAIDRISGVISIRTGVMYADQSYLAQCICDDDLEAGHYVFVEVADTGCGMTGEVMKKIFDPFYTTKFTGRGLGMSAVLGIIRGHGGALKLYSEVGQGTTFRALLPSQNDKVCEADDAEAQNGSGQFAAGGVLVVDDEESIREIAAMMLENTGIKTVFTAEDGRKALDIYSQHRQQIDIVLLDYTMPHMDGEETFRRLRMIDPDVRVVLASGYSKQSIQDRFAGKGLSGFIQKPYSPEALEQIVRQAFEKTA